ncbi:other/FunK1 protein kinase [Coprinopsis cinerea okayama7|uniref:Other/FunK1 protein kinase n=1 Tax=Coprinopsis cinerea (strain Okayama-7 / 130 / ATCC MYA-4618 / FGSC 9003) TaxID=240176 RepID=A8NAV4_COPC7|nr:other/FunK1 protein kinase [Coprinopsis cinerea okayama7\|eukprot:XP_001831956.2 other/FunK1 protein kinase [Coprinopsis cinerea okayama7\
MTESYTCSFEEFFDSHLPSNGIELDPVIGDLKKQKMLVSRGQYVYQKSSSSTQKPPFMQTFKSFKSLFRSTISHHKSKSSHEDASNHWYRRPLEENVEYIAHGCITSNSEGPLRLMDVVVPIMGVDSRDVHPLSDEVDVVLLSHFAQIVNGDARGRFCFAVTFIDSQVTLWRFSRSLTIKSTPFDMTEHPDLLIQLLVIFLGSQTHLLGYDSLVTLLPDSNYVYEIPSDGDSGPLYYKTAALICDSQPTYVSGRSLRIWEVEQVESVSNPVRVPGTPNRVLKDVILDATARTEADIQEELFADMAKLAKDESWSSRPFLKDFPQCDIDVLADALEGERFKRYFSCIIAKYIGEVDNACGHGRPIRRCHFVYERICTPLDDITTLGEAVDVLRQALIPLRLMFCAGWVHRDVSPGNILAYRQAPGSPWTVKLSDLEHAKKFPDPESTGGDRITGTPYFIACEVLDGDYPSPQEQDEDCTDDDDPDMSPPPHEFVPVELVKSLPKALLHSRFLRHLNRLRKNLHGQYIARNNDGKYSDISTYSWIASGAFDSFFNEVEARRDEWADIEVVGSSTAPRRELAPADKSTTIFAADAPPPPSRSPPNQHQQPEGKPSRKRPVADSAEGGRAQKRARKNPVRDDIVVPRRSGPTTRSMALNERRVTRSTTRRLEEEKKKRRLK